MPLYDVKCHACLYTEERLLKLDQTSTECRQCGATTERLKPSQFAFNLKDGAGAYKPGISMPNRKPA